MPNLIGTPEWDQFSLHRFVFQYAKVPQSANVQLSLSATDATSGSLGVTNAVLPFGGSIVAISWSWSGNIATGTFTATPQIGPAGSVVSITNARLIASAIASQQGFQRDDAQSVKGPRWAVSGAAPQLLAVNLTTTGAFPNATLDVQFDVYVMFDNLQV